MTGTERIEKKHREQDECFQTILLVVSIILWLWAALWVVFS